MQYIHTMGYWADFKRNEILTHTTTLRDFENIMLIEINTKRKLAYNVPRKRQIQRQYIGGWD